jgi:transcriptional regulator with XRE-family HTH domain
MQAPTRLKCEIDDVKAGRKVRHHRLASEISVKKLAYKMGISTSFLSDLELGKRGWTDKRFREAHNAISKLANKNKL